MNRLLAICESHVKTTVKRVVTTSDLLLSIKDIFTSQEEAFLRPRESIYPFYGEERAEEDELFQIDNLQEIIDTFKAVNSSGIELESLSIKDDNIKALAFQIDEGEMGERLIIQNFNKSQIISTHWKDKLTLLLDGNTFTRMTGDLFSLSSKISAIAKPDGGLLFDSFNQAKKIFSLNDIFIEANEGHIEQFISDQTFGSIDRAIFEAACDNVIRKNVYSILNSKILSTYNVSEIHQIAQDVGFSGLSYTADGKIALPNDKKDLKLVLKFLAGRVVRHAFTKEPGTVSSYRPLTLSPAK